jgi:hypothetical protein
MSLLSLCASPGVGQVHLDAIRNITGNFYTYGINSTNSSFALYTAESQRGAFKCGISGPIDLQAVTLNGQTFNGKYGYSFSANSVVPVAAKNQPRAWGALACVYLGLPAS